MQKGFESAANGKGDAQPSLRFHEIGQDAPQHIVAQLVGHDDVHTHGADSVESLRRFRLGGEGFTRTCYALLDDETVISAIYVHKGYERIGNDRDLSGNVTDILHEETAPDDRAPKSKTFYSITNIKRLFGAGQHLVVDMYAHLTAQHPKASRSTLSPLRSFDKDFSPHDDLNFSLMSTAEKKRVVLEYLLTGDNAVQQFHMGNGARIADIKLDTGDMSVDKETGRLRQHFAMVNYAYDVSETVLKANAAAFGVIKRVIRSTDMDPAERATMIRTGILPTISAALMQDTGMINHGHIINAHTQSGGIGLDI